MSAGVSDQRMKGQGNQVTNGPKDHVNEHEDFDSWRSQHHQGYNTPISSSMASDPYMSNYYGTSFPYQAFGVGDGTWSNGDPMTFLSGYGGQMGHDSYGMDGMFGGGGGGFGGAFGQPAAPTAGFNYFHGNGDYSTWGSSAAPMSRKQHYEDYYRTTAGDGGMYGTVDQLKGVEQSMQGLSLTDPSSVKMIEGKAVEGGVKTDIVVGQAQPAPKKMTWASVASQPAKPQPQVGSGGMKKKGPGMPPPPMVPGKHNMDIGTWEGKNGGAGGMGGVKTPVAPPPAVRPTWAGPIRGAGPRAAGPSNFPHHTQVAILAPPHPHQPVLAPPHHLQQVAPPPPSMMPPQAPGPVHPLPSHPVLDELRVKNNYNPVDFDLSAKEARFFVIKSYSEDDIHRSIKYEIWCSTEHGNKRLDDAYRERDGKGVVYLFFSVNGSGHFCGMARMVSAVDYHASSSVWAQDKWKGQFKVRWIYVKDVPNVQLRHIRLENNENKPVTNSRDTQEVPFEKGRQVLKVIHQFRHTTSIFDDFVHYEKRQEEEDSRKEVPQQSQQPQQGQSQAQGGGGQGQGHGGHGQAPSSPPHGGGGGGGNDRQGMSSGHHNKDRDSGSGGSGRGGRSGGGGRGGGRNN